MKGSFETFYAENVRPCPGKTLVVGSRVYDGREDRRLLFADALGVDMLDGPGVDVVANLEERSDFGPFAHVDCVSVLEHCRRPWKVAENIEAMMLRGGTLFVSVPFCWRVHAYPDDYFRFTPAALEVIFPNIIWLARGLGHETYSTKSKIPAVHVNNHPYLSRTETFGFGIRGA